jgi:hypothetical protein
LADLKSRRSVLNSPPKQRGCDEFKSLGQASSELIAKLGKGAKVGAKLGGTAQPPSKSTLGRNNVIYLNLKGMQKRPPNRQNYKASHDDENHNSCRLFYIFH